MTYDPVDNAAKSYAVAIEAMREKLELFERVQIGDATLYRADCREVLPLLPKVDAVVTDPPYGIGAANGASIGGLDASGRYKRKPRRYDGDWDDKRPDDEVLSAIVSAAHFHIVWGGQYFADVFPIGGRWLFWDKLNSMPTYSDGEMAWTTVPGVSVKKFTHCASGLAANRDGREHPTQKPIALMKWCIEFIPDARTILDPFMGSGTTGVACVKLGRKFIGIEIDPGYFATACKRIEQAYAQPDFFVEAAKPKAEQITMELAP